MTAWSAVEFEERIGYGFSRKQVTSENLIQNVCPDSLICNCLKLMASETDMMAEKMTLKTAAQIRSWVGNISMETQKIAKDTTPQVAYHHIGTSGETRMNMVFILQTMTESSGYILAEPPLIMTLARIGYLLCIKLTESVHEKGRESSQSEALQAPLLVCYTVDFIVMRAAFQLYYILTTVTFSESLGTFTIGGCYAPWNAGQKRRFTREEKNPGKYLKGQTFFAISEDTRGLKDEAGKSTIRINMTPMGEAVSKPVRDTGNASPSCLTQGNPPGEEMD